MRMATIVNLSLGRGAIAPAPIVTQVDTRLGADPCNGCSLKEWCAADECAAQIFDDKEDSRPFMWPPVM